MFALSSLTHGQSIAQWDTDFGRFRAELREDLVPITVNNFIGLANENFYDGLIFHRVVAGFVIQDGDPTGTGEGGSGVTIPLEIHPEMRHDRAGTLGMARGSDPNSASSQYYFTLSRQSGLDDNYAVFGHVIQGLDVVLAIGEVPVDENDRPLEDVVIDSVRILGVVFPHFELTQTQISDHPDDSDGDGVLNPLDAGQLRVEVKNWLGWNNATQVIGRLIVEDDRIAVTQDSVAFGTIAPGDSTDNFNQPFEFEVLSEAVFSTEATLRFEANPDSTYPFWVEFPITIEVSLNQAGWPLNDARSTSSALVLDLDEDGTNEAIFADDDGYVHAYRADGQSELPGFPVPMGAPITAAVAAYDINDDGKPELVAGSRNNLLRVIDFQGQTVFEYQAGAAFWANPMVADVNEDNVPEVIAIARNSEVLVFNPDGSTFGDFPVSTTGATVGSPALADLDGDGYQDIIFLSSTLNAISTATGENLAGFPVAVGGASLNGPAVADVDQDSYPEILLGLTSGDVVVINHDGTEMLRYTTSGPINASVVAADVNQDAQIELITITNNGDLFVIDSRGNDLPGFPRAMGGMSQSTPVLADLNGNGTVDLIFGTNDGLLHVLDINGEEVSPFPISVGGTLWMTSPAIADLDGDHDLEILLPGDDNYTAIDVKTGGRVVLPFFKANPGRTGQLADTYTNAPAGKPAVHVVEHTFLERNYPNPFNPKTTIRYGLATPASVRMDIYDISGKFVRTLVHNHQDAGFYQVQWDGRNQSGKALSSGLYLYRLQADTFVDIKPMILLR